MIDDEQKTVVVIDNGSNTIKAGFGGDDALVKYFLPMSDTPRNLPLI